MTTAVLDHVAVGGRDLTDGWDLFCGLLGGSWIYGGDVGFWWGQLQFAAGPKIELITPTASPDSAFLERFLAARGAGPHHFNFIAPDIRQTLERLRGTGIEPVGVQLDNPNWQEAFLHPKDAFGIVVQVAQQGGKPPALAPPAGLPPPGPPCAFALVEHYVGDLRAAVTLFRDVLDGEVVAQHDASEPSGAAAAELTWRNGARLRLIEERPAAGGTPDRSGRLGALRFERPSGAAFTAADLERAARLSGRLGVPLEIGS